MTSPSPTSQRKKRAKRSSARKLAVPAEGPTSARTGSSGSSEVPASGKGKRRRPATQDFPWSFPRLDKATVPPPDRCRASAGVGGGAEAKAATSSELSSGSREDDSESGGGGSGDHHSGNLRLSANDIAVACAGAGVLASVSASRLDELFFGGSSTDAAAGNSDGEEDMEGVSRAVGAGRGCGETSPTPSTGCARGAIGDCGLFEDLAPLSASLYSSPIPLAAVETKAEAEAGAKENVKSESKAKSEAEEKAEAKAKAKAEAETEAKANVGSSSCSRGTPAASTKTPSRAETPPCGETSPEGETPLCHETPPCSEEQGNAAKRPADRSRSADGGRTEGSWPSSVGSSGGRSLRRGTRRASAVSAIEDIRLQAAGGEAGRGVVVTYVDVQGGRRRRRRRDESDSGRGAGGAGDSASSSSVQETPSPQVCALETPPSSLSERRRPSSSSSPPASSHFAAAVTSATSPCENDATTASPPAAARSAHPRVGPEPTEFCADVPETQPPPPPPPNPKVGHEGATRRIRSGKVPRGSRATISQTPSPSPRTLRSRRTTPESQRGVAGTGGSRRQPLPPPSSASSSADVTSWPDAGEKTLGVDVRSAVAAVTAVAAPEEKTEAATEAAPMAAAAAVSERRQEIAGSLDVGICLEQCSAPAVAVPGRTERIMGSPRAESDREGGGAKGMSVLDAPMSLSAGKAGGRQTGLSETSPAMAVMTTAVAMAASTVVEAAAVAAAAGSEQCLPPPSPPPSVSTHGDAGAGSASDDTCQDLDQKRDGDLALNENEAESQTSVAGGEGGVDARAAARSEDPAPPVPDAVASHAASPSLAMNRTAANAGCRGEPEFRGAGEEKLLATEAVDSHVEVVEAISGAEETADTPARPRQLAGNFDSACGELGRTAEGDDDAIASEGSQHDPGEYGETPSSGALFDYSPAGYSQMSDGEDTKQGVTAAEMLVSFKRNIRPDLPAPPTPSSTLAAPAPVGPTLSPARGPLLPPKSRVTPRVPNPYDTGVGKLLTPRARAGNAKPLPASPFALAASAAAARRQAAVSAAVAAPKKAATMTSPRPALPVANPHPAPPSAGTSVPSPAERPDKHATRPGGNGGDNALHPERATLTVGEKRKASADRGVPRTARQSHTPLTKVGAGPPPFKGAKSHEDGLGDGGGADVSARLSLPPTDGDFQTARGKRLAVSAEALAKVKHLFDDTSAASLSSSATDAVLRSTGTRVKRDAPAGKAPPPPSLTETNAAATLTAGVNSTRAMKSDGGEGVSRFGKGLSSAGNGFQTARGRPLAVSDEALAKVQHLFKEDSERTVTPSAGRAGPRQSAAKGGRVDGAYKAPSPALEKMNVDTLAVGSSSPRVMKGDGGKKIPSYGRMAPSAGSGFQTGRGRPLAVSDEALAKVQHLFREETEDIVGPSAANARSHQAVAGVKSVVRKENPPPTGLGKATVDTLAVGSGSASAVEYDDGKRIPSYGKGPPSAGNGFQTARGRPLAVSDEALAKVQHLFKEESAEESAAAAIRTRADARPMVLATTGTRSDSATNKAPTALRKASIARPLTVDGSGTRVAGDDGRKRIPSYAKGLPPVTDGFQTVGRTDKALAKVQHLSKQTSGGETNRSTVTTKTSLPLEVGLGRQCSNATMSPVSLEMAADASTARYADPMTSRRGRAKSEATVCGKGVRSAGLEVGAAGFQTGRGRAIPVSSEALAKVQHIFCDDLDDGSNRSDDNTSGGPSDMRAPQPPGYPQHSCAKPTGSTSRPADPEAASATLPSAPATEEVGGRVLVAADQENADPALPPSGASGRPSTGDRVDGGRSGATGDAAAGRVGVSERGGQGNSAAATAATTVGGPLKGAPCCNDVRACFETTGDANARQVPGGRSSTTHAGEKVGVNHEFADSEAGHGGYSGSAVSLGPPSCIEAGGGFRTARGRALVVSAEALAKVGHLFESDEPGNGVDGSTMPPSGKKGELARKVRTSKERRTVDGSGAPQGFAASGCVSREIEPARAAASETSVAGAGGCNVGGEGWGVAAKRAAAAPPRQPLESGKPYLVNGGGGGGSDSSGCSNVSLFSTGGGKAIKVSAEALARVDKMFSEAERIGEPVQAPQKKLKSGNPSLPGGVGGGGSGGGGSSGGGSGGSSGGGIGRSDRSTANFFSTGGGKAIEVSAEALARVENMFSGSDRPVEPAKTYQPPAKNSNTSLAGDGGSGGGGIGGHGSDGSGRSSASLFSTGGGNSIEVSAEALRRVANMFSESEPAQNQPPSSKRGNISFAGDGGSSSGGSSASLFSTGGGKAIEVSAEALARVENMFSESERFVGPAQNQPPRSLADGASGGGPPASGATSCANNVLFQAPPEDGADQSKELGKLASSGELEHFRIDDGGNGRGRDGSRNGSMSNVVSDRDGTASVFSTGGGRRVEVSAEALARAQKMLGEPDPCPTAGALNNQRPTLRAGAGDAGRADGSGGGGWGDSRSVRSDTGKENAENEQRESSLGASVARRAGACAPSPLAGRSPMSTRQRSVSTPVHEAATGGQSPALGSRAVFSPPKRASTMPPPAGVSTPSSLLKRPLARRPSPAGSPAPSPIGRVTPQPSRGRGAVCGVSSSGGLHATKRPRSASMLSSSAKRRGVAGRGAFPRHSPGRQGVATGTASPRAASTSHGRGGRGGIVADNGDKGSARAATAPSGLATLPEPDCWASRVLFRSLNAADAEAVGMNRQRRQSRHRRPLSSLLNEPPQVSETLPRAGLGDTLPADEPAQPAGTAAIAAAEVETAVGAARLRERRNAGSQQSPVAGNCVGIAGEEAILRAAVTQEARGGIVAELLERVTAANACNLRFFDVDDDGDDLSGGGSSDGRPCCFTEPPGGTTAFASKSSTGVTVVAGGGLGCVRHRRSAQEPRSTRFRDELLRGGGDGQLATPTWVENHVRWIVWKLAATERRFPAHFPRGYLTADRVAHQLRYRYDVELDRARKPCLKAVLQGDASASRPMVLCVSRVYNPEDLGTRGGAAAAVVEVTDGWYPVDASLDEALAHFLRRGKIVPGTKLSLSNAALVAGGGAPSSGADGGGAVAGVDPLELLRKRSVGELPPGAGPRLRLVVNSTRRARWDARLGFFRPKRELPQGRGGGGQGSGGGSCNRAGASCEGPAEARGEQSPLEVPLCTVVPGGGIVTATRVLILRRYPAVYISEGFSGNGEGSRGGGGGGGAGGGGGGGALRRSLSEAEEEGEKALHQAKLQRAIEAAASGMEEEVMAKLEESTPDLFRRMKEAENPSSFFDSLDMDDQKEVSEWRERHQQVVEGLRQKAMDDRLRNMDGVDRRVRQLITLRVACVCSHAGDPPSGGSGVGRPGGGRVGKESRRYARGQALPPMVAVLKLWGPNEATAALLTEGAELRLHSVTASSCHYHVPGCSLELSAGRQTKIEVMSVPSPSTPRRSSTDPTIGAARPTSDHRGDQTVNPRFVPRRHTPLSAFSSPPTPRITGGAISCGERVGRKAVSTLSAGPPIVRDAAEADFVGCLFAVTRESRSPIGVRETFASPDSVVSPMVSGGGGGVGAGAAAHRNIKTGSDATDLAAKEAEARGQARDANDDPDPEFVIYHVYLTDSSGACVRLKKRVRRELARHHRILRSAPGTCWAVVNAGRETTFADALGSRVGAGRDVLAVGDPKLPRVGGSGAHDVQTVSWSSMTAVGGNGSAPPPRAIGGTPTGHLEQPLLALRRWAEGGDGRGAVSRERQRLAVLLAREGSAVPSAPAALQPPPLAVIPGGGEASVGGDASMSAASRDGDGGSERKKTRMLALLAQGREALESAGTVVGFASCFSVLAPSCIDGGGETRCSPRVEGLRKAGKGHTAAAIGRSSRSNDATLWVHVDTGGRMLGAQLSERALAQLLGLTLDVHGRSSATCRSSTVVGPPGGDSLEEGPAEVQRGTPRKFSEAIGLLRTIAALGVDATREEHIGGIVDVDKGGMETPAEKRAAALAEPPAAPAGKYVVVTENTHAVTNTVLLTDKQAMPEGGPDTSLDRRVVDTARESVVAAASREDAVDALTAAVFGMVRQCRHSCGPLFCGVSCPAAFRTVGAAHVTLGEDSALADSEKSVLGVSVGSENAREPTLPATPAPTIDAGVSADDTSGRVSRLPRACGMGADSTVGVGSGVGATEKQLAGASVVAPVGGSGCVDTILLDLASACGKRQMEFSVLRSYSQVLGREVGVVESVGAVDATRSARSLLRDLAGSSVLL